MLLESDGSMKPSLRAALLKESSRRFELQQTAAEANYLAPISPTPPELIREALSLVSKDPHINLSPGSIIIDLGCGDGRWLLAAAGMFRGVSCAGYDLDEALLRKGRTAWEATDKTSSSSLTLYASDLLVADVSSCSLVIVYLFRDGCEIVQQKLQSELPPTAGIISVGFQMRGWEAKWTLRLKGCVPLYFYAQL